MREGFPSGNIKVVVGAPKAPFINFGIRYISIPVLAATGKALCTVLYSWNVKVLILVGQKE